MLVEVDEDHDGDHDADAAEHDPGPSGPAAPQGTIGGVDVYEGLPSDPDGWDTGQDEEEEAQQAESERVSGVSVDGVRGDLGVRVGLHPGVRPRRVATRERRVARAAAKHAHERPLPLDTAWCDGTPRFVSLAVGCG
jgi:hypothetical protein